MKNRKPPADKTKDKTEPARWGPAASLNRDIQTRIGAQLRQVHDDIVREGVPDRFVELLAKLGGSDPAKDK
jgi:hypothetical protein